MSIPSSSLIVHLGGGGLQPKRNSSLLHVLETLKSNIPGPIPFSFGAEHSGTPPTTN